MPSPWNTWSRLIFTATQWDKYFSHFTAETVRPRMVNLLTESHPANRIWIYFRELRKPSLVQRQRGRGVMWEVRWLSSRLSVLHLVTWKGQPLWMGIKSSKFQGPVMTFEGSQQKLLPKILQPSQGLDDNQRWLRNGSGCSRKQYPSHRYNSSQHWAWPQHRCWRTSAAMHLLLVSAGNTRDKLEP